ncbi:alpha/beta fold hydrolase [Urbifossiella limnaea]|uniref:Lysophospholipase L2 n=1 Tax=Urbifossiella limnaea TaxID=2528023 RepID=A0A517XVT3_9BACT|nr:alpha/beta fold hydrolase [Urbifossiella limnaea]QDU21628.1 lysophospholipase L2 [Urbifossiella limnaea]
MTAPLLSQFRASDGYCFYTRFYPAAGEPRGRLVFVHGIRSHGGWYTRSCSDFAAAGFDVHFLDRRGAGLNTVGRSDAPSFRRLIDDAAEYVQHLRAEKAWLPVVLAGISWGGKLAAALPYRRPGLIDGMVLLCPGLVPRVAPPLPTRARIALARVFRPGKFFPIPLNEPELFTADAEWRAFLDREPHGLRAATARFLFASFGLDIYLRRAVKRVTVPTLLVLGEHDRIIDNAQTRLYAGRFGRPVELLDYPGAHHTLEFEPPGHPWVGDVTNWMERRLGV